MAEREIGLPASVSAGPQGNAPAFRDTLYSQPLLITAVILAVYIVLVTLYESSRSCCSSASSRRTPS